MNEILDKLKAWSEMPFEGDPLIDTLLGDIEEAVKHIEALEARIKELEGDKPLP